MKLNSLTKKHVYVALAVIAIITLSTFMAMKYVYKNGSLNEVSTVIGLTQKHYLLPADEEPALLTVTDSTKLTTPFLKQAENGDKVLVYQQSKVAVIYRPSIDRVVAVGPVQIDTPPKPED